jgi:L-ribulose-5-phosphate 4-epimerase
MLRSQYAIRCIKIGSLHLRNVSAVDRDKGVFAIKPSGVPYAELKPEDMVILDFDANIIEGKLRPSSDTKTHAFLYKNWEKVGGISHTHAIYSVAWAQSQLDIPIFGLHTQII